MTRLVLLAGLLVLAETKAAPVPPPKARPRVEAVEAEPTGVELRLENVRWSEVFGWFAKQSSGTGQMSLAVCYQNQSGPGPITVLGSATSATVGQTAIFASANGSGSVPAGTYTVGSCAQNLGVNSINKSVHSAGAVYSGS